MIRRMERNLLVLILVLLTGCASFNPYARESKHMLKRYSAIFCWVPSGEKNDGGSCKNERAAPSLAECVEELRPTATFFTGEEIARQNLALCMERKGWQLLFIDGVILGERPDNSRGSLQWGPHYQSIRGSSRIAHAFRPICGSTSPETNGRPLGSLDAGQMPSEWGPRDFLKKKATERSSRTTYVRSGPFFQQRLITQTHS